MEVLILAAGDSASPLLLEKLLAQCHWVITADGGAQQALQADVQVDAYVGDGDSITPAASHWLEQNNVPMHKHPTNKDQTDLELALHIAFAKRPQKILIVGGWGERSDHTLCNLFLLEACAKAGVPADLWAGLERLQLLNPGKIRLQSTFEGQRVSLLPISERVESVVTQGLRYPLKGESLWRAASRGISNEVVQPEVQVEFSSGLLLVVQAFGLAELNLL